MVRKGKITFLLVLVLLGACRKNKTKTLAYVPLAAFQEVQLNSPFDVVLVEDTTFFVNISGFEKTVEKVETYVENGTLFIENPSSSKFLRPKSNGVTIYIHSLPLTKIQANETCFITTKNPITSNEFGLILKSKGNFADLELNGNIFYYWNNYPCGGKLTLRGNTNALKIWNTAIFSVDARNVTTNYCLVENSSKGKCEVNVTGSFEYSIKGEGDIDLYGSPGIVVEKERTGTGKLVLK